MQFKQFLEGDYKYSEIYHTTYIFQGCYIIIGHDCDRIINLRKIINFKDYL